MEGKPNSEYVTNELKGEKEVQSPLSLGKDDAPTEHSDNILPQASNVRKPVYKK